MTHKTILLLRHCQTVLSGEKRLIGQCDVALSSEGIACAEEIGKKLKKYQFGRIVCSTLKRSSHTAEIISSYLGIQTEPIKGLNEINLGMWDGKYVKDIKKKEPEAYENRGKDIINYRIPEGENFIDLSIRVKKTFEEIRQYHKNMIIVGHKSVNRIILSHILQIPLENIMTIPQEYGCCNRIEQKGRTLEVQYINKQINKHEDLFK